MPRASQIIWR